MKLNAINFMLIDENGVVLNKVLNGQALREWIEIASQYGLVPKEQYDVWDNEEKRFRKFDAEEFIKKNRIKRMIEEGQIWIQRGFYDTSLLPDVSKFIKTRVIKITDVDRESFYKYAYYEEGFHRILGVKEYGKYISKQEEENGRQSCKEDGC